MNHKNVNVILLAAGLSKRMGDINKMLLPINNVPMVRHMAQLYLGLGVDKLIVVTGHQHQQITAVLQGLAVQIIYNENFAAGQKTSMRCAIPLLSDSCEIVLVALADQPLLQHTDLTFLLKAYQDQPKSILIPYFLKQRGNPVLLSKAAVLSADAQGQHIGCRKLIDKFPRSVFSLAVANNHFTTDIDTVQDAHAVFAQLSQHTQQSTSTSTSTAPLTVLQEVTYEP